ncbi:capsule biosynthesis GfcC D2 domain-containing protein [Serratia aquatilis]|uniref:Capsule biosynthesis GfcC D2 domain-containing protein n=1 Tax=Serratia aquatilis TaxID=1737515 RepID=A0ABV6EGA9_9GAMM
MKKINLLFSALLCLFINVAIADSRITVSYPGKASFTLENVPTLEDLVVNNPALPGDIWWQGAAIAERGATQIQQQKKQQLLARLAQLSSLLRSEDDASLASTVDTVRSQIAELNVVGRQFVQLDPDFLQLRPDQNHRLVGEYQLFLAPAPHSVKVLGALAPNGKRDYLPGKDVSDYLDGLKTLKGSENSNAWIITAQGKAQPVPIAYWNRQHNELTPGDVLFLGFAVSALPKDYKDINEQIISLLTHRIPD